MTRHTVSAPARWAPVGLAGGLLALVNVPAHAASGSIPDLCSDDAVTCSIQVPSSWIEGETHTVAVTGRPRTTVTLQAHRMVTTAAGTVWAAHGDPVAVTTGRRGYGDAELMLPALDAETPGGAVLVAVEGADLADLTHTLGAWTTLRSRTPALLGDGWGEEKPVGTDVTHRLEGAVPGTAFDVEINTGSRWVAIGTSTARPCSTDELCDVTYRVPRGLPARAHEVRLLDLTTGTPVGRWIVVPSETPVAQQRSTASTAQAATAGLSDAVPGATAQAGGGTINAVRQPRAANLELPDGAQVATVDAVATHAHPARLARGLALTAALAAVVASVVMLCRRPA